jgi:serine/threonine protein kinase
VNPQPFGYYTLINRINVGGMAEVFKACYYQEDGHPAFAAIKRILPHLAQDRSFVEMFLSEATTAGRLQHPNIAQIIEQGEEQGEYFISMEYISGRDLLFLRHHLRERGMLMSPALSAHIAACVADALDYAHALCDESGRPLEIIHRDVSPQNILISYEGEVKLIDFGIAKAKDRGYESTRAGILKGKFGYMAPEQVRGLDADHRLDIFALGVVLYELLTNQRLFLGETDMETLDMVREGRASAPSLVSQWISPELDRITLRALAADPNARYQRASEMARDLRVFIQREAPITSQGTLKSWMYQEFSNYIAHERAQDSHILEQLNFQVDAGDGVPEQTMQTPAALMAQLSASYGGPAADAQAAPAPGARSGGPFQTQQLMAVSVSAFTNDDVPTRPVSAEIFKDLQSRGFGLPSAPAASAPDDIEELLNESLDVLDDSDLSLETAPSPLASKPSTPSTPYTPKGALSAPQGVSSSLLMERTAPISESQRDELRAIEARFNTPAPAPAAPAPALEGYAPRQTLPFSSSAHMSSPSPDGPSLSIRAVSAAPALVASSPSSPPSSDRLERVRAEERERAASTTGPIEQTRPLMNITPRPAGGVARLALLSAVALIAVGVVGVGVAGVISSGLLSSSAELLLRVTPPGSSIVQVGEGEAVEHAEPAFKVSLSERVKVSIRREGFKEWTRDLDPSDPRASTGIRVELEPLQPPVMVKVSSSPMGARVWLNGEELRARTPLTLPQVQLDARGEVRVRMELPGLTPYEQAHRPRAGKVSVFAELKRVR